MSDRIVTGMYGRSAGVAHGDGCVSLTVETDAMVLDPPGARALAIALIEQAAASESVTDD